MEKEDAKEIIKESLENCDKVQKTENKTPLRKALEKSYTELCKLDKSDNIYFTQEEVSKICSAIIASPVDTSRELQDKVLKVLQDKVLSF